MVFLSKKVFIEPSVIVSFIDRAHPKHEQTDAYFRYFSEEEYQLFIDYNNLIETYSYIYKDISPSLAKDFLRTIELSNINIIYPEESDARAALKTLVNFKSLELSYPKALIAVLCYRKNIPQIYTYEAVPNLFGLTLFYLPL